MFSHNFIGVKDFDRVTDIAGFIVIPLATLTLASCGGGGASIPATLTFAYQAPATYPPGATLCQHHFSPLNLTVTTDKGTVTHFNRAGPPYSAALPNPGPGEHWLYVIDIGYCGEFGTGCPAATTGVSLNGVTLTRQVQVPAEQGCVGLAYHVSAEGVVTP